ncbi:MAG: FprA family A-type flavoprotein [Candidatus Merdivicinus sp.]|jgi:flavorubredoxin
MSAVKLLENLYSVGILNPGLRVFDIVMATEYGTSYNSYLVRGGEKTALVECSHLDYFEQYLANIREVCEPSAIDCLVLNHTEPDHAGSVARLLEQNPEMEIYCSQAASIYIRNITNRADLKLHVVKDGETLDLGGKTLEFRIAPFLHWPDSMFTWLQEDRVLFSCDFLGSHYCEPYTWDYNVTRPEAYEKAFKGYYDAIFGPFPAYVRKGLDKISDLDPAMVCTSHGPVLTKGCRLEYVKEKYAEWSAPRKNGTLTVPVFYCSAYGNTAQLAERICAGIKKAVPEACAETFDIIKHPMAELAAKLNSCDGFAIGSPTINRDAVPPVWVLLSHVDAINSGKRPALIFGSYGWSGEAAGNIKARLEGLKMSIFEEPFRVTFVPSEDDLLKAEELGERFAASIR